MDNLILRKKYFDKIDICVYYVVWNVVGNIVNSLLIEELLFCNSNSLFGFFIYKKFFFGEI